MEITKAEENDVPAVIGLIQDFAEFEKLSQYCRITEDDLRQALFGPGAFVEGLIVRRNGEPIAYALFYPNFASFRGQRGFYLEDIYIAADHRGHGVGDAMLKEIARLARSRGFERIDFQVLEWNTPAVKFYEELGAVRDGDERHFKFTDEAFDRLASE
jgi:GNAT superfamily N-acetyltransferase